jgi:hypothetical protein
MSNQTSTSHIKRLCNGNSIRAALSIFHTQRNGFSFFYRIGHGQIANITCMPNLISLLHISKSHEAARKRTGMQ